MTTRALLLGLVLAAGCGGAPRIEPSPPLPKPTCRAPDVVDGEAVTPVAVGDTISGHADSGERYAFCAKPGTWVRFKLEADLTVQQPLVRVRRGSAEIAENRFFALDADPASQLLVPNDDVYVLEFEPTSTLLPTAFGLTLARPQSSVVVEDGDFDDALPAAAALAFGDELWGSFAGAADVDAVALPAVEQAGVLVVRAAVAGFFGNGATVAPVVEVVDAAGAVQAKLDYTDKLALELPVFPGAAGDALSLRVSPSTSPGERPFYALEDVEVSGLAPALEHDDAGNGTAAGAEPLDLVPIDLAHRAATVAVTLSPGDVDMFSFAARQGETVHFICKGESAGSGVRELEADLRAADGTLLLRAHEEVHDHGVGGGTKSTFDAADARSVGVPAGTYYGEVRAGSFAEDVAGRWALCTASAGPG